MSEHLPLPAELFQGRPPRGDQDDTEIHRLMRLADKGEYLDAALEAADLLRNKDREVRLVCVYLAGAFVDRGPAALPAILECVDAMHRAPSRTDARRRDAATKWLFRGLSSQIAFHTVQRSDTWSRWLGEVSADDIDATWTSSQAMCERVTCSAAAIAKIGRWARDKLGPASQKIRRAQAQAQAVTPDLPADPELSEPSWDEPSSEDFENFEDGLEAEHRDQAEDPSRPEGPAGAPAISDRDDDFLERDPAYDDADFSDESHHALDTHPEFGLARPGPYFAPSPPATRAPEPPADAITLDSGPLLQLRDKLRGFELLVERGELDKAAIIANDIQQVIDAFDPVVYLPTLFARYFQLLSRIIPEVEDRWDAGDSTAKRVLTQFYRADLDGFVNE